MAYYNPFQQMAQATQMMQQNPFAPRTYQPQQQVPPINPQQFCQFAMTLNDNSLAQFAQMARQRGISDADIQAGINFIKSL